MAQLFVPHPMLLKLHAFIVYLALYHHFHLSEERCSCQGAAYLSTTPPDLPTPMNGILLWSFPFVGVNGMHVVFPIRF